MFLCGGKGARCGIGAEIGIQLAGKSHRLISVYLLVEEAFSQAIPNLFTPGIDTPTRCGSWHIDKNMGG